jgi:hypothetical protein
MEQLTTTQLLEELNKRVIEEGYIVGLSNGTIVLQATPKKPQPPKPLIIVKPKKEFYFDPLVMEHIMSYVPLSRAKVQNDITLGTYASNVYKNDFNHYPVIVKVIRMTETSVWVRIDEQKVYKECYTKRYKRRNGVIQITELNGMKIYPKDKVEIYYTKKEWENSRTIEEHRTIPIQIGYYGINIFERKRLFERGEDITTENRVKEYNEKFRLEARRHYETYGIKTRYYMG